MFFCVLTLNQQNKCDAKERLIMHFFLYFGLSFAQDKKGKNLISFKVVFLSSSRWRQCLNKTTVMHKQLFEAIVLSSNWSHLTGKNLLRLEE